MRRKITLLTLVLTSMPVMAWEVGNPGAPVNTECHEAFSAVTPTGLAMFISSDRPGGYGAAEKGIFFGDASYDIYVTHRDSLDSPWGPIVNLGPNINTKYDEQMPSATTNGSRLFFNSDRPGGNGGMDIYEAVRDSAN